MINKEFLRIFVTAELQRRLSNDGSKAKKPYTMKGTARVLSEMTWRAIKCNDQETKDYLLVLLGKSEDEIIENYGLNDLVLEMRPNEIALIESEILRNYQIDVRKIINRVMRHIHNGYMFDQTRGLSVLLPPQTASASQIMEEIKAIINKSKSQSDFATNEFKKLLKFLEEFWEEKKE